jgi:16S rRNA (guanine527-N7)-methyltransferase
VSGPAPASERELAELSSAVSETFGERAALARTYADLLVTEGIARGVLGPGEAARIWPRHIFNSTALAGLIPAGARVVDLGSGAGLPGIPLALARPDLTVVLLEPMQRRAAFLRDCLSTLALPAVEVVVGRAEDGISPLADYVVARAVTALDRLAELSFGLLVDSGVLLALKGASVLDELEQCKPEIAAVAELLTVPAPGGSATVVRVIRPVRSVTAKRPPRTARQLASQRPQGAERSRHVMKRSR